MVKVEKAEFQHIDGIIKVCSEGYRDTYKETHSQEYIERTINEFYNFERIYDEILNPDEGWDGWYVALKDEEVVGAIGGGMTGADKGEIFVLYLDPARRGEGIGTRLLEFLTDIQKEKGAVMQWVSVSKGNQKGIPFYEARGFQMVREQKTFASEASEDYTSLRYCRKIR
ncbi:GNAT family N-acetyltransferase [Pseudalkalibacillus caeni]|uniref:GNAT family N-acetyltransferase n=1 Tax=Exobacillus caeni TaxID=2574798 RepID=A0A5R9F8C1_9BACL|nr:GNAT family N-acetyltransferase [Pseudalkalibacillus caeni]TLS37093.1 GNAT family N-acetyltransferase [Pseudalkalibacillus caeni]